MTDGHIRVGNTPWHGIAAEESPPCETLRVCFYFTALSEKNGCVRSPTAWRWSLCHAIARLRRRSS